MILEKIQKYINDDSTIQSIHRLIHNLSNFSILEYYKKYKDCYIKKTYNSNDTFINNYLNEKQIKINLFIDRYLQTKNKQLILEYILPNLLVFLKYSNDNFKNKQQTLIKKISNL